MDFGRRGGGLSGYAPQITSHRHMKNYERKNEIKIKQYIPNTFN
jgi:hypothetical protein